MKKTLFFLNRKWLGLSFADRISMLFFVYACGLFPLLGGAYAGITTVKTLLILIPGLVFSSLLLFLGKDRLFSGWGAVEALLLLFLLWAGVALLCSPFGFAGLTGAGRSGGWLGLCFFLLLWTVGRCFGPGKERLILTALSVSLLLMNSIGFLQLWGGNPLHLYPGGLGYGDGDILYAGTFLTTIGNTGQLGAFYCLSLPLLLFSFFREKTSLRWVWLAAFCSGLLLAWCARLDAALLALFLGLPLAFGFSGKTRKLRFLMLGIFLLLLVLALLWLRTYQGENTTLLECARLLNGEWEPGFGSWRLGVWRNTWLMLRERLLLGFGPDCFRLAYGLHYPGQAPWDAAHNEYLGYWCELGLPGLLLYAGALGISCWRLLLRGQGAWGAMLLCYGIQAGFSFPTFLVAPLFWLLWGVGWGQMAKGEKCPLVSEQKA